MKPPIQAFSTATTGFWKLTKPPKFFSWQTLLWVTVIAWLIALVAQGINRPDLNRSFASLSTLMLAFAGIVWAIVEKPIKIRGVSLAPWLAGCLTSTLLYRFLYENAIAPYGTAINQPTMQNTLNAARESALFWPLVLLPLICLAIKIIPELFQAKPQFHVKLNDRLPLVILVFSHLLITWWIQFAFEIQAWINVDPLLTNRAIKAFQGSLFVMPIDLFK